MLVDSLLVRGPDFNISGVFDPFFFCPAGSIVRLEEIEDDSDSKEGAEVESEAAVANFEEEEEEEVVVEVDELPP